MVGIACVDIGQQLFDSWISIELFGAYLKHVVCAHTTKREVPDTRLIFRAIRMSIEVARTLITMILKQANQEEQVLQILTTEAQILVETRTLLVVQVDMEELTGL